MRVLWISSLAWKKDGQYVFPVNGAGAVSGSLFQQSMIEGLEAQGHTVDIVCDYPHAPGQRIKPEYRWSHRDGARDIAVRAVNLPYVSILFKSFFMTRWVKKKAKETQYDVAIAYLIHQPYMACLAKTKKLCPKTKTVLICPDLPDMMDMTLSEKKLKAFLKKLDMKRIDRLYKKVDGYVLFAEPMKERVPVKGKPWTVIEGVASVDDLDTAPVEKERFIMYAGTLHKNIGVENIIKSLDYIDDPSVTLKLYGTGELETYIKNAAAENPRIVYGGFVDRKTLFEQQKKALALVNARNPKDAYTRYSFPSKTFEYLYSGTPFVSTKLAGVSAEYDEHIWTLTDDSPKAIADQIQMLLACDAEKLMQKGAAARQFVLEEKTNVMQSKRLLQFITEVESV